MVSLFLIKQISPSLLDVYSNSIYMGRSHSRRLSTYKIKIFITSNIFILVKHLNIFTTGHEYEAYCVKLPKWAIDLNKASTPHYWITINGIRRNVWVIKIPTLGTLSHHHNIHVVFHGGMKNHLNACITSII